MLASVTRVVGAVLRQAFVVVQHLRHPRPIHSRGLQLTGTVTWLGNPIRSGIRWIDEDAGVPTTVRARVSRSVGLPAPFPDIYGLALRLDAAGEPVDIEWATTGMSPLGRFALLPHLSPARAFFGTLFPYRSDLGPVLLGARTVTPMTLPGDVSGLRSALARNEWRLRLYWARGTGCWHPFAELSLADAGRADDADLRFDAVRHPLPGAGTYDWVRAVRQPTYLRIQRADGAVS